MSSPTGAPPSGTTVAPGDQFAAGPDGTAAWGAVAAAAAAVWADRSADRGPIQSDAEQEFLDRRLAEAANPATGPQRLAELAVDANWLVRRNVVTNPAVTPVALGLLADDDNQITRSLVAEHPLASPATLERLAGDPEPVVRAAAAARHDCPSAARAHAGLLAG